MGQDTINFEGQEVKVQGHTTPKLHLEDWRRHHFRPFRSSKFSISDTVHIVDYNRYRWKKLHRKE